MEFFKKLESSGIKLNKNQAEAISYMDGPLLVAAGPGSGKTSVITARTAYLIQHVALGSSIILVITFTRAAANEMKLRFSRFPGIKKEQFDKADFGTFHSTFYKIINTYYGRRLPVLETKKIFSIIKKILRSINEPYDDDTVLKAIEEISSARTMFRNVDDFKSQILPSSKFMYLYSCYENQKKAAKCIDFDDMMIMCKRILESEPAVLQMYRKKYKYFLIDEFQDTSRIQMDIVEMLCHPQDNICVVGDDDQSIYGFRGAIPNCMKEFENHFSQCRTVVLDTNYRSSSEIIEISSSVISNNTDRKEKNLKSFRGCGTKPVMLTPEDENEESSFIAKTILALQKKGYNCSDMAVLYRTNIQSRAIIDELIINKLPFTIKDNVNNFFSHWISTDLTCYLKLSSGINDLPSLIQIINRPVRYITKESISKASSYYCSGKFNILNSFKKSGLKDFQMQKISDLFKNLPKIKCMSPTHAVKFIRKTIGYDDYIRDYCSASEIDYSDMFDILDEYEMSATSFRTIEMFLSHINEVSSQIANCRNKTKFSDGITLSTIHGAKGLEFSCVFVCGSVEGILPHRKSLQTGQNIDEERRIFYVAITRAKDLLYILAPKRYHGKRCEESRFFREAQGKTSLDYTNAEAYKFSAGDLIYHNTFGTGKILKVNSTTFEVLFGGHKNNIKLDIKTCFEKKIIQKL